MTFYSFALPLILCPSLPTQSISSIGRVVSGTYYLRYIRQRGIHISMHANQFVTVNSLDEDIYERSLAELIYHAKVLVFMDLDGSAKIQLHVGGAYGGKVESKKRFTSRFHCLPPQVKNRLVIENDDRLYTLSDCLTISDNIGIPVLFDSFHHQTDCSGQTITQAFEACMRMWKIDDGIPMLDYSSQKLGMRRGNHAETLDYHDFTAFLNITRAYDVDIMLEIKDKEISALRPLNWHESMDWSLNWLWVQHPVIARTLREVPFAPHGIRTYHERLGQGA